MVCFSMISYLVSSRINNSIFAILTMIHICGHDDSWIWTMWNMDMMNVECGQCWIWTWWMLNMDNVKYGHDESWMWTMLNMDNVEYGQCWIWTWWMLKMDNVEYGHNECCIWTTTNHLFFLHLPSLYITMSFPRPCPFGCKTSTTSNNVRTFKYLHTWVTHLLEHSRELDVIVCVRNADGSALLNTNPINRRTVTESK